MPTGVSLALYRIVQEALTNVRKHAGPGATAEVRLCYRPGEVLIRIADDGGCAPVADGMSRYAAQQPVLIRDLAGHGLTGMRERASLYGGTLAAGPGARGGFEVAARVPISMAGDAA
jgi:signal transduction histidine kinase